MSRNLVVHFFKDLKARHNEIRSTQYTNVSIFVRWSDKEFKEERAQEFLEIISDFNPVSNKIEIDLRDNCFRDQHMKAIANMIKRSNELKELNLWLPANYITDKGAADLFACLDNLKKLQSLTVNLEWNFRISNKSMQVLCSKIRQLTQLKFLRVFMTK